MQERFGDIEVLWGSYPGGDKAANGDANEPLRINVIEAFLKLSLEPAPNNLLDARLAACECMKAFFAHHPGIRMHVLRRAIEGHTSGQDRIPNILSVLLTAPEARGNADPYQVWMACILMFHLLFDDAEAKATAMAVTEGDADSGEEVVTSVQSVVGNLITGLQRGDDERITVGYLTLLCGWLFEDPDVVNDLLGEGSCIQTLLQEIKHQRAPSKLVPGLCTVLLGVIYEFSTKDSPIPRITLHKLLIEQLGREQYIDKITRLRECPLVRDFEVLPQTAGGQLEGGLPEVFFDRSFIEFLKDNFSRLLRAIDREPEFEISVVANGIEKGISRELVDSLRAEIEDRTQTLQTLESDLVSIQRRLDQEQLDHRKTKEYNAVELSKVQQTNQSLQQRHAQELSEQLSKLENEHKHHKNELLKQHSDQLRAIDHQLKQTSAESESKSHKARELREHHEREVAGLQQTIRGLESELSRTQEQHTGEVVNLNKQLQELKTIISQSNEAHDLQVTGLQKKIQDLENTKKSNDGQVAELNKKIKDFETTKGNHDGEVTNLTKKLQSLESTLATAKQDHEAEVSGYKSKVETLESTLSATRQQYEADSTGHNDTVGTLESNLVAAKEEHEAEIATLKQSVAALESDLAKAQKSSNDLETAQESTASQTSALEARAKEAEDKAKEAESHARSAAETLKSIQVQLDKAKAEAKEKEEARQSAQSELEDLLIVFGDLEAKRTEDKVCLIARCILELLLPLRDLTNDYLRNGSRSSERKSRRPRTTTIARMRKMSDGHMLKCK